VILCGRLDRLRTAISEYFYFTFTAVGNKRYKESLVKLDVRFLRHANERTNRRNHHEFAILLPLFRVEQKYDYSHRSNDIFRSACEKPNNSASGSSFIDCPSIRDAIF